MGKRISRRELKEWNKALKLEVRDLQYKLDTVRMERNTLDQRLTELGSRVETYDVRGAGIECIEIKPEPWGQYCVLYDRNDLPMDAIKQRLVQSIAEGLMKSNNVQLIVQDNDLWQRKTIGAKLYVVPWDKMAKRIVIQKR